MGMSLLVSEFRMHRRGGRMLLLHVRRGVVRPDVLSA